MKPSPWIAVCLAWVGMISSVSAGEPSVASTSVAPGGAVLRLAPDDALAVLYARDLGGLLDNPALAIVAAEGGPDLPALGRAWQAVFDGPTMLAVRAPGLRPEAISVCLAARVSVDETEWFRLMDEHLASALTMGQRSSALIETGRSGDFATLRLTKPPYLTMYLAYREGLVYGSTALPAVMQFAEGNDPGLSFVQGDDFRRIPLASDPRAAERLDLLAYLNLRPLVALLRTQMRGEWSGVFEALELDGFETVAVTADFSSPETSVDVSVGMANRDGVLPRLVLPATGKLTAAALFPDDYVLAVGGALTSASDWVDGLCGLIERLDPDIVDEYQRERAKVTREFGFDPQGDFLGNMVDEWAFGLTADADHQAAGVLLVKLADTDLFVGHLRNLVTAYRLPIETRVHADTEILVRADGGRPDVALAVHDDYLMVSNSAETIANILDARQQGRTIRAGTKGPATRKLLTSPAAAVASFNVARLAQLALAEDDFGDDEANLVPTMERVAASQARITLAAQAKPRALSFKVVFNDSMTVAARDFLTKSLAASWASGREQTRRLISMANVRGIITSCQIYANEHKGDWPTSLGVLAAEGSITPSVCCSPYDGGGPLAAEDVDRESFYIYRPGLNVRDLGDVSAVIVVAEREIRRGQGAAFGFVDGHVEWIAEPEAGRLLAELRSHMR